MLPDRRYRFVVERLIFYSRSELTEEKSLTFPSLSAFKAMKSI